MIVKESRIKTRSGHQAVSRHVLSGPKNEAIRILSGSDYLLKDWMKEARRENIRYGLRHIAFNPSEHMSDGQLTHFANQICRELGADPERLTLVIHQKDGGTHGHLLLPEWQEDHVLSSKFTLQRLEKIARLEELRLGHDFVSGRHDKAIAKALREAGNPEAADRIAALGVWSRGLMG
ncbi:relaxase/mobilization nuclease domain-containing protein, partial [Gluconobacter oxydans]